MTKLHLAALLFLAACSAEEPAPNKVDIPEPSGPPVVQQAQPEQQNES